VGIRPALHCMQGSDSRQAAQALAAGCRNLKVLDLKLATIPNQVQKLNSDCCHWACMLPFL